MKKNNIIHMTKHKTTKFEELGKEFKELRESTGLSLSDLTNLFNLNYPQEVYEKFENGFVLIEPSNLIVGCIYLELFVQKKMKFDYGKLWYALCAENGCTRKIEEMD